MRAIHFPHLASQWLFLLLTVIALGGCSRSIGDTCETDQECPTASLCDVTVPGGYCTIQDCEVDSCPESSVCIRFDRETTYCMRYCEVSDECGDGQICRRDLGPAGFCFFPSCSADTCDGTCIADRCLASCEKADDCATNLVCIESVCVPPPQ